jgi:hypothetical protein
MFGLRYSQALKLADYKAFETSHGPSTCSRHTHSKSTDSIRQLRVTTQAQDTHHILES